jgi:hypothetical protein
VWYYVVCSIAQDIFFNNRQAEDSVATLIGLNFIDCIHDILQKKVPVSEVRRIISAHECREGPEWDTVIERYIRIYWAGADKTEVLRILSDLEARRVIFCENPRFPIVYNPITKTRTVWVTDSRDIVWGCFHS